MFKVNDKEYSTKITLGLARKLKESEVVDLLDVKAMAELTEIMSSPLQKLDLLWEVVKRNNQLEESDRETFEDSLEDIDQAFKSLEADIESFIQALGKACSQRWSSLQKHAEKILNKEMETIEGLLESKQVTDLLNRTRDDALKNLGEELKS